MPLLTYPYHFRAVYLVRHRKTGMRFALKKMNKQSMILRNKVKNTLLQFPPQYIGFTCCLQLLGLTFTYC